MSCLSIIPLVSMSKSNDDVKNTYWTAGEFGDNRFYIGLEKVVLELDGHTSSFSWDDDECSSRK